MRKSAFTIICIICLPFVSCKKNKNNHIAVCDGSSPTYNSYVQSIITSNCSGCHGVGSNNGDFSTYAKLSTVTSNGKFEKEVLTNQSMPQSSPLPDADLDKLKCWIEAGFPEN